MQRNYRCVFKNGCGLFPTSWFNPAALWYKRCKTLVLTGMKLKFPQKVLFALVAIGDYLTLLCISSDPHLLAWIAFLIPSSRNEYLVFCLSSSQCIFISQLFLPSYPRWKMFFFLFCEDMYLCLILYPTCYSGTLSRPDRSDMGTSVHCCHRGAFTFLLRIASVFPLMQAPLTVTVFGINHYLWERREGKHVI